MEITIRCNSLQELQEAVETIYLIYPERAEKVVKKEKKQDQGRGQKVDRDEIRRLMKDGHSNKTIAEIVGCGYSTVCNIVRELKV